jgi:hypothetical protein
VVARWAKPRSTTSRALLTAEEAAFRSGALMAPQARAGRYAW